MTDAIKQADPTGDPEFATAMANPGNRSMAETLKNIGLLGLGGIGGGAAIRGFQGLRDLVYGTTGAPPKVPMRHQFLEIPIPARQPKEREGPLKALAKAAAGETMLDQGVTAAGRILQGFGAFHPEKSEIAKAFWNPNAARPWQHPWAIPAAMTAVGGGLALGYGGAGSLIGKAQDNEDDTELSAAKKRYESALSPPIGKQASEDPYAGLDRVWDVIEKQASTLTDDIGPLAGLGMTGLGITGLLSGLATYNYVRDKSPNKAIDQALQERRENLFSSNPPVIMAVPREVEPKKPSVASRIGEHLSHMRLPKQAATLPGAVLGKELTQMRSTQEAARMKARQALGIEPEVPKPLPKPVPPAPYRPPSTVRS